MTNLSRRIHAAEVRLPPEPATGADALRRRLTTANEVCWFVGVFGSHDDYLTATEFARRDDHAGALSVAEHVNQKFDGAAIEVYRSMAFELLTEKQTVRVWELVRMPHPQAEPLIGELQDLIFRTFPCCDALNARDRINADGNGVMWRG